MELSTLTNLIGTILTYLIVLIQFAQAAPALPHNKQLPSFSSKIENKKFSHFQALLFEWISRDISAYKMIHNNTKNSGCDISDLL